MGNMPALPALAINQDQPGPLEMYSRLVQLRSMMQNQNYQQQVQPLELQQRQLQNQQMQMQVQGQQKMQQLFASGKYVKKDDSGKPVGFDIDGIANDALAQGVPMGMVTDHQNKYYEAVKNKAAAGAEQLGYEEKVNKRAYDIGESIRTADPTQQQAVYQAAIPQLKAMGFDLSQLGPQYPGDNAMKGWESGLGLHAQMLADAKEKAQTGAESAKAALDNANAFLAQNKGAIIAQYKQNPGALDSQIDAIFPANTPQNQRYKFGVRQSMQMGDVEAAQQWVKQASEEKSGLEKESYTQGAENFRQALNRQAMFSNELQKNGLSQLDKLFTDPQHGYTQFLAQANATKNAVADAKDGNELAASLAPLMTVLGVNSFAGVHRINPQEYAAAGPQVGSVYRRINAALDKATAGKLQPDTAQEMGSLIDGLISAKHASLLPAAQMVAQNAGLDPKKTTVMGKDGKMDTLANVAGKAAQQSTNGGPQQGYIRIQASDGSLHDLPQANLGAARQRDPGLKVVGQQ